MRSEPRVPVDEPARLQPNGWSRLEVRLLDVSANGFSAHCEARVPAGTCVKLDVPGYGSVLAYVIWRNGNRFGARFADPIDVARCGWGQLAPEQQLARMLVDRAAAVEARRYGYELELRRRILDALPVHRPDRD